LYNPAGQVRFARKSALWCAASLLPLLSPAREPQAQGYSVRAIDAQSGKPLKGIPITLRYSCTTTGAGVNIKFHCRYLQRKTGADGIARFPEAGSLKDIDDIYSLPIRYGALCCDISNPVIPGTGTIKFKRRSLAEMLHWIFVGD
jgi:hypothetical protein